MTKDLAVMLKYNGSCLVFTRLKKHKKSHEPIKDKKKKKEVIVGRITHPPLTNL